MPVLLAIALGAFSFSVGYVLRWATELPRRAQLPPATARQIKRDRQRTALAFGPIDTPVGLSTFDDHKETM